MDDLDPDLVRRDLEGTLFADLQWVSETGSTNADLLAAAREGAPEGLVLVADHQTSGRGRRGRTWEAPPGSSLLLSVLTRPSDPFTPDGGGGAVPALPTDRLFLVSMAMGIAAVETLRAATGADVRLKWPNDLVVGTGADTRKLSGILAESLVEGDQIAALVVGIGINVNWPATIPDELAQIATAANHVAGRDLDRAHILTGVLRRFAGAYERARTDVGRASLRAEYLSLSATVGSRVRVELAGETVIGDAVGLTDAGHLLVVDDGPDRPREITVGDVVHLRPH